MSKLTILKNGKAIGEITFVHNDKIEVNVPATHKVVLDRLKVAHPLGEDTDELATVGTLENAILALNDLRYESDYDYQIDIDEAGDEDDSDGDSDD